jgi:hypothetical protein
MRAVKTISLLLITSVVVATAAPTEWKTIAGVSGNDKITQIHITNLLLSHDIKSAMVGSVLYDVAVPSDKAEEAAKLLRIDAQKHDYWVLFGSNDVVRATECRTLVSRTSVSSTLKKPEFTSATALGKFLRSKKIAELTAKYPYIISLSIHERQYLATPKAYSTGYDVKIELKKSPEDQAFGYRGSYQVYDGGGQVECLGSERNAE